jgi:hypothetical protein
VEAVRNTSTIEATVPPDTPPANFLTTMFVSVS